MPNPVKVTQPRWIDSDGDPEYFTPTFNLRWKLFMCPKPYKRLEQMWRGNNGTERWEAIEIVRDGSHKTVKDEEVGNS